MKDEAAEFHLSEYVKVDYSKVLKNLEEEIFKMKNDEKPKEMMSTNFVDVEVEVLKSF